MRSAKKETNKSKFQTKRCVYSPLNFQCGKKKRFPCELSSSHNDCKAPPLNDVSDPPPRQLERRNSRNTMSGEHSCAVMPSSEIHNEASSSPRLSGKKQPLVILVVGMAGTGKTTLVHRLQHYSAEQGIKSYFINLDPALLCDPPYDVNIDIRDTVNYRELIQQYRLGPNGGIMTTLNLYATKFHEVIHILEKKCGLIDAVPSTDSRADDGQENTDEVIDGFDWIVVDTPGQIEVFTWSASGQLITEAFASTFPTVVLFVADTSRCSNPQSFMSTMLYSSSIMFKYQLPLLVAFNKTDVSDCNIPMRWMRDADSLADAVRGNKNYSATLTQSLSLFVHEFYESLVTVGVSAVTGAGMDDLRVGLDRAKVQYHVEFLPIIREKEKKKADDERNRLAKQMHALHVDSRRDES
jgi:GPN-loop GTPase